MSSFCERDKVVVDLLLIRQHGVDAATSSFLAARAGLGEALPNFGGVWCSVCGRLGKVCVPTQANMSNICHCSSSCTMSSLCLHAGGRFMDLERCLAAGLSLDTALQIQGCLKNGSLHDGTNYSGSMPLSGGAASTSVEAKRRRSTRAQNWLRSLPAALALFDRSTLSTETTGAPRLFPGQYVVYHAGCVVV